MLKNQEGAHVFISESALYRTQLKDLGCLADGHPLKHNYGLQAYISDSSKIWVVYQMDDL